MPYVVRLNKEVLQELPHRQLIDYFFKEDGTLTNDVSKAKVFRTSGEAMSYRSTIVESTKIEEIQCV